MKKIFYSIAFVLLLSSCRIGDEWTEIQFDKNPVRFGPEGGTETITATTMSGGRVIECWDVLTVSVDSWKEQQDFAIDDIINAEKSSPTTLEISVSPSAVPRTMTVYISGAPYYEAEIKVYQE